MASLASQLYAIGGYDGTQHLNSTECYSACTDRWMTLKDMKCKRCYVGECVVLFFYLARGVRFRLWRKAGFPLGEFVRANREKNNLIGWRETLTSSPANHIRFLLVRANKFAKCKTGL